MEKTFDVNHSQTVNGITITLERVEMTATEMSVYAFYSPPDYIPPDWPTHSSYYLPSSWAEYRIDDGATNQAGGPDIHPNPLPIDAKELTFIITELGDREGPCEFKVPLE